MLGYYNPSVILTYLSLVFAGFGISRAIEGGNDNIFAAIFFLMLSGVCDMFDGAVAARCKRNEEEKLFGIQIDSLCDLVAFGCLPACITLSLAEHSVFSRIGATLILLSSVIRLGFFNVQETVRDREEKLTHYTGLPVTTVALLFPAALLVGGILELPPEKFAPACLCLFSAMEVSRLKLKKPYGVGKWIMLFAGILVFAGIILSKLFPG
ncbi:MAG: CDP-alcohol phosphatidyltransferase family protein [Clostridia bacterium]|nr:CDP-alcohol phosphatidyltransferase family protein [Clostridia bacterium]